MKFFLGNIDIVNVCLKFSLNKRTLVKTTHCFRLLYSIHRPLLFFFGGISFTENLTRFPLFLCECRSKNFSNDLWIMNNGILDLDPWLWNSSGVFINLSKFKKQASPKFKELYRFTNCWLEDISGSRSKIFSANYLEEVV